MACNLIVVENPFAALLLGLHETTDPTRELLHSEINESISSYLVYGIVR